MMNARLLQVHLQHISGGVILVALSYVSSGCFPLGEGTTAMTERQSPGVSERFLENQINQKDLVTAIRTGDITVIQEYLSQGGPVNYQIPQEGTMLYCAVRNTDLECVRFLLSKRANPFVTSESDPLSGRLTPRDLATHLQEVTSEKKGPLSTIIEALIDAEQNTIKREHRIRECLVKEDEGGAIRCLEEGCVRADVYREVLEFGLKSGQPGLVSTLFKFADFSTPPSCFAQIEDSELVEEDKKLLLGEVRKKLNNENLAWVRDAIQRGDIGIVTGSRDKPGINDLFLDGKTLLMQAAASGNLALVKYLLSSGASPSVVDASSKSALDHLCTEPYAAFEKEIAILLAEH